MKQTALPAAGSGNYISAFSKSRGLAEVAGAVGEILLVIFLHLGLGGPARAASSLQDTVKASKIVYSRPAAIPSITLDSKVLRSIPSTSVADAIKYFSGVQIKDYGGLGGLKTVNVRSLGSQHVGVFYNGVKIVNAQNGQVDLGRYSLENLESVTLYQGQKADLLQTASDLASAAAVYMKTRTPERTGIKAGIRTGAFGTINPSLFATYAGKVKISADASWLHTNGRYRFTLRQPGLDTSATRANGQVKALRTELALSYRGLKVNAYFYNSSRGLPGPVVRRLSEQYDSKDCQWDRTAFIQGTWNKKLGSNLRLLLTGKFTRDFCRYLQDPSKNAAVVYIDNRYHQGGTFLSAAASWTISPIISAGLALDGQSSVFSATWENKFAATIPGARRLSALGAAQILITPVEGWRLQGSLLYTRQRDKVEATAAQGGVSRQNLSRLTPTVILSWQQSERLTIRGIYKEIFRSPTFNDLYYSIGGRTSLQPEFTRQGDLGFDFSAPLGQVGFSFGADGFISSVRDKIMAMPSASQFRWTMKNYGKVRARGVEVNGALSTRKNNLQLDMRLSYSYQDARDVTDRDSRWYKGLLPYSPRHSGSATGIAGYKNLRACLSFLYTGARYRNVANIAENRLKPWFTTDFSLAWQRKTGNVTSGINLDVINLFNEQYEIVSRYPMPGRYVLVRLTIEY